MLALAGLLAASLGVASEPARYLQAMNGPPPGPLGTLPALPAPPTQGGRPRVILLVVDGLRLDASEDMPQLKALRARGADVALRSVYPSYSRPAYATLLSGAGPGLTNVRNNRYVGPVGLDTILQRARDAGVRTVCVANEVPWLAEIAGQGCESVVTKADTNGFVRAVGVALSSDAGFVVVHWLGVDRAGHAFGGASGNYIVAVRNADTLIGEMATRAEERGAVFAVVSDHGHSDHGGHGGLEPDVMEVPFVVTGPGVLVGVKATGHAVDVAATLSVLARLPIPAASEGAPLADIVDPALVAAYAPHVEATHTRLWRVVGREGDRLPGFPSARAAEVLADRAGGARWWRLLAALAVLAGLVAAAWRTGRVLSGRWTVAAALVSLGVLALHTGRGDPVSLSSVEQARPFLSRLALYVLAIGGPLLLGAATSTLRRPSGERIDRGLLLGVSVGVGALLPWLLAVAWASPRPFPEMPGPASAFLPVLWAAPASLGAFGGALVVMLGLWFDSLALASAEATAAQASKGRPKPGPKVKAGGKKKRRTR